MFIYSFAYRYLGCSHLLAIVNSATMNICVQVSESLFSILLSIYLQVVNSMLRDYQIVFHSSYTTPHFHQQYMRVSVSPYPYKFIIHFLNYKHPVDVKWNFIVVLSCIPQWLMILSISSCAWWRTICTPSLEKCQVPCPFFEFFVCCVGEL